ncbi:hypothetical protein [Chromohalobacter sp. 11-W]|uniref:hypothetical protein n=1 Tax=Chromohalobacter sp. 11-W TaxID=2994061 RepID=UPI002468C233|nr:hypothetical protein [Chromohalobacter sp. 11-W]
MNKGFKIQRLIVTGLDCDDAVIKFASNAHVIIGPSNTGKSYIFQCVKYLLGSTNKPKRIKESYGYESCYLEICLANNSTHTIRRSLSGGDASLYECSYAEISKHTGEPESLIVGRKATKTKRTLNSYFLSILDLEDRKVRRNKGGVSNNFSFSFLRNHFLIDEISIIKEDSPVYTGQNGEGTKEESILRFLLTGKDDSAIASKPKQRVIDNRKGRMEVLDRLIEDYQKELSEFSEISINSNELDGQIERLGESISIENERLKELYEKVDVYESTINRYWTKWKESESRLLTVNELISRLELLGQHYDSDLYRLESLQESSAAYANLDFGLCPICNSKYDLENHEACSSEDIDDILLASSAEMSKIESLKIELGRTKNNLDVEKAKLLMEIKDAKLNHNLAQEERSKFMSEFIKTSVNELDALRVTLRDRQQALKIVNKLNDLIRQKEQYEVEVDPMDGHYDFDGLTTSTTNEFCEIVQGLLYDWGYSENPSVSFSEETCDLVIDGHDRNLAGKGYRALSYAAFCVGLMHTCLKNNLPHSGTVILDSPLCTLRSRHVKREAKIGNNDIISDETKEAFYSSIAKYRGLGQIVVLDNDGPSNPRSLDIGYTEFTEDTAAGRYGFFTPEDNE